MKDRNFLHKLIKPQSYIEFLTFSLTLFIVASLIGFSIGYYQPAHSYNQTLEELSKKLTDNINFNDNFSIMTSIWKHNLAVGIIIFFLTSLLSGLVAYSVYTINGGVVGYVLAKNLSVKHIMLIVPHGIIEVPTIILFGWIGVKYNFTKYFVLTKNPNKQQAKEFIVGTLKLILLGAILLLISAFVEAYITPTIASKF